MNDECLKAFLPFSQDLTLPLSLAYNLLLPCSLPYHYFGSGTMNRFIIAKGDKLRITFLRCQTDMMGTHMKESPRIWPHFIKSTVKPCYNGLYSSILFFIFWFSA